MKPRVRTSRNLYGPEEFSSHDIFLETVSCEVIFNSFDASNYKLQWFNDKSSSLDLKFEKYFIKPDILNISSSFYVTPLNIDRFKPRTNYSCCLILNGEKVSCTKTLITNKASFFTIDSIAVLISTAIFIIVNLTF